MDIVGLIKNFFGAVSAVFGFATKKTELANTPEMQTREKFRKENEATDKDAIAIKNKDEEYIKNTLSS